MNVQEVLDRHDVEARRGSMRCLSHDDSNPSASIVRPEDDDGFVYCHTCGWTVDAAGLEAALSGRPVAAVLAEWRDGQRWKPTLTKESPHKMRWRLWLEWVEMTQWYIDLMRTVEPDPDLQLVAVNQLATLFDDLWRAAHGGGDEQLPPHGLKQKLEGSEQTMVRWFASWVPRRTGEVHTSRIGEVHSSCEVWGPRRTGEGEA